MVRKPCVYKNLVMAMLIENVHIIDLSEMTGIEYKALCKRLNGDAKLSVEEAIAIYEALEEPVPMQKLFARSDAN